MSTWDRADLELRVKPADMAELPNRLLRHWKTVMQRNLIRAGHDATDILKRRTREVGAIDMGTLATGWRSEVKSYEEARVYNVAPHQVFVERGRRAGATPPPARALVPWVERHFGVTGKSAYSAAIGLAKSIGKKGIKARPIITHPPTCRAVQSMFAQAVRASLRESGNAQ